MKRKASDEVNTNMGLLRTDWLWLDDLGVKRARRTGGRKPTKKELVREAIGLLRAAEART